jgi:predicted translin family RNA/ssDNA-binding protein
MSEECVKAYNLNRDLIQKRNRFSNCLAQKNFDQCQKLEQKINERIKELKDFF